MNGTTSKSVAPYVVSAIVSVFLILIAYAMFFQPKINESKSLVDQTAKAHLSNSALTAKVDKLTGMVKNIAPLRTQVAEFGASFPSAADQQNMMDAINQAASSSGVSLTTLSPAPPKATNDNTAPAPAAPTATSAQAGTELPGAAPVNKAAAAGAAATASATTQLGSVSVKIDGSGSLEAVQAFVVKIEALKRPMLIHEVQIEKIDSGYHVMLNGETFLAAPLVEPDISK